MEISQPRLKSNGSLSVGVHRPQVFSQDEDIPQGKSSLVMLPMDMVLQNEGKRPLDLGSPSYESEQEQKRTKNESTKPSMDSKEIASAVALASLASFSPSTTKPTTKPQDGPARREGFAVVATAIETRSPASDPIPITPDVRSPIRAIKRVHFASNINKKESEEAGRHGEFQSPRAISTRPFPPPGQQNGFMFPAATVRQPHWMSPAMPQRVLQQPLGPSNLQWICDFCNAAAFNTYEEACLHEESCKVQCRRNVHAPPRLPVGINGSLPVGGEGARPNFPETHAPGTEWFSGSISLAIPDSDAEWLSEINCYNQCL